MARSAANTIMVVDDDTDIVIITQLDLERAGFLVHAFSNPVLALQHIESGCQECGILISDIRMPHMNGFQLAKRVRHLKPEMKLVLMTAFEISKKELEAVAPSTQIDNVIKKPFPASKLVAMVEKISSLPGTSQK